MLQLSPLLAVLISLGAALVATLGILVTAKVLTKTQGAKAGELAAGNWQLAFESQKELNGELQSQLSETLNMLSKEQREPKYGDLLNFLREERRINSKRTTDAARMLRTDMQKNHSEILNTQRELVNGLEHLTNSLEKFRSNGSSH